MNDDIVSAGDPLEIAAADWNEVRRAARNLRRSTSTRPEAPVNSYRTSVVLVRNNSGAAMPRFGAVGLGAPLIDPAIEEAEFSRQPTFSAVTPVAGTHEGKFGILLEPLAAASGSIPGAIGACVVAGIVQTKITVTGTLKRFAEIANGTTTLQHSDGGSARIIWAESSGSPRWALVRLGDQPLSKAREIYFSLPSSLSVNDASKAGCTVHDYWQGASPGATVTVYNKLTGANYFFSGAQGAYGFATYDDIDDRYFIFQLQCGG